jgi:hypothetical protein
VIRLRLRARPGTTREQAWQAASVLGFFLIGFITSLGAGAILAGRLLPLAALGGGITVGTLRGLRLRGRT